MKEVLQMISKPSSFMPFFSSRPMQSRAVGSCGQRIFWDLLRTFGSSAGSFSARAATCGPSSGWQRRSSSSRGGACVSSNPRPGCWPSHEQSHRSSHLSHSKSGGIAAASSARPSQRCTGGSKSNKSSTTASMMKPCSSWRCRTAGSCSHSATALPLPAVRRDRGRARGSAGARAVRSACTLAMCPLLPRCSNKARTLSSWVWQSQQVGGQGRSGLRPLAEPSRRRRLISSTMSSMCLPHFSAASASPRTVTAALAGASCLGTEMVTPYSSCRLLRVSPPLPMTAPRAPAGTSTTRRSAAAAPAGLPPRPSDRRPPAPSLAADASLTISSMR
mmetsp:Transcript_97908/g.277176  ORF Transcript_97908/g.277176 Transcript_97908/m.277176 type:complete len:332 (+) Transcript_97908:717-1712(+)